MKKSVYILVMLVLIFMLFAEYIPGLSFMGGWVSPPVSLLCGLIFALVFGEAYPTFNKTMSKKMLQYSVVGLGFGMNVYSALASGGTGMLFTIISVFGTLLLGWFIGTKLFKIDSVLSYLISAGTAICGGSAIAAVGPIVKAKSTDMTVSLGVVFILNAVALFIFPAIGKYLSLSDQTFGTWVAIAIHDTSSVVGAAQAYSEEALNVATTIKLTRALWIIPVALLTSFLFRDKTSEDSGKKIAVPMFIIFFIVALLLNTYLLSEFEWGVQISKFISITSKKLLTLTLFFIGAGLSKSVLKSVGIKPLIFGILLWIIISVVSLLVLL
ncbi:MAG: putative sulfate exporter family transporter [Paludibacteraceae bacterium]|nr:putative sulfate exporter family transporter [Paludibacteraceae bacterium]